MYARRFTSEETYTLAEARKIIEKEQCHKREVFLQKAKQKMLGILAIGVSIAEFALGFTGVIDEGGAFIIMLPLGIYAIVTKENILN